MLFRSTNLAMPSLELWADLNSRFDLDEIVEFSYAWHVWEFLPERNTAPNAWDQELFFGGSAHALDYHAGIRNLAKRQLEFVIPACVKYLRGRRGMALDLGAGLAVQMSALRNAGLISSAICIDTPFVADRGREEAPEHMWIGGDLRSVDTNLIPSVDLIWVGNLLHHYGPNENQAVLNRFAMKLAPEGVLVVQEYVIGLEGLLGLVAAAIGVHFALTTSAGRNYPESFISAIVEEAVPGLVFDIRADGAVSSLLFFRRR